MLYSRGAAAYRKVHMETSPVRILDALLGRLLEDLEGAKTAIINKDIEGKTQMVDHALSIVGELNLALDRSQAPELCRSLHGLYGFVEERLLLASLRLDPGLLDEAMPLVESIRGAFRDATGMET